MSERPGPSPEEIGNPEQAEKDRLFSESFRAATELVLRHPKSKELNIGTRFLGLDNVGEYSEFQIDIASEGGGDLTEAPDGSEAVALGGLQFWRHASPDISETYEWVRATEGNRKWLRYGKNARSEDGEIVGIITEDEDKLQIAKDCLNELNVLRKTLIERGEI